MARVEFNGEPGTVWTNQTEKVQYQLIVNWHNSCGLCIQYDHAIGPLWPTPFHHGCRSRQRIIFPGKSAEPFVDFRAKIDVYRRLSRVTDEGQVDDLAAELVDRFGPLPAEVTRMLEFARLRVAAAAHGIDSITRQPGMLMIGHHDLQAIQRLRVAWQAGGKTLRVVGEKSAVVPLDQRICDDPDRLLATVRTLLRPARGRPYSPGPVATKPRT